MSASKLEAFVASLPSRPTSTLLALLFADNRNLYVLVADVASDVDDGYSAATRRMSEAANAIRAEIDLRIPARQEALKTCSHDFYRAVDGVTRICDTCGAVVP